MLQGVYLNVDNDQDTGRQWGGALVSSRYVQLDPPLQFGVEGLAVEVTSVCQNSGVWIDGEVITVAARYDSVHYLAVHCVGHVGISRLDKRNTATVLSTRLREFCIFMCISCTCFKSPGLEGTQLYPPSLQLFLSPNRNHLHLSLSGTVRACFIRLAYLDLQREVCSFLHKHLVGVSADDGILVIDISDGDFQLCAAGLVFTVSGLQSHRVQGSALAIQQGAVFHKHHARTGINVKVL